jgi:hypothetical protein
MPYAGTLLGCEVQTQSMQPPSFTEKALRRLPSSVARESQKKSDNDCGAIFDPIQQIANSLNNAPECTYPNKYHVKNFKHS